jgi:hypothetical protein
MMDNSAGRGCQRLRAGICGRRARAMLAQPVRPVRPVRSAPRLSVMPEISSQISGGDRRTARPGVQRDEDGRQARGLLREFNISVE